MTGRPSALRLLAAASLVYSIWCRCDSPTDRLRGKLERGEPVKVVVFGDSISAGWQVPDPDRNAFYSVFHQALSLTFPEADIRVISRGYPGAPVAYGLSVLGGTVLRDKPDLVTVQFGGNDERDGTILDSFKRDLSTIVQRVRSETGAAVIVLVQPFQQRQADSPTVVAVRDAARALGAPLADFDAALRARPYDMRGWFAPFFNHPREYSSNTMARELWEVCQQTLGRPNTLDVSLRGGQQSVPPGGKVGLTLDITSRGVGPEKAKLLVHADDKPVAEREVLIPRGTESVQLELPVLPPRPWGRCVRRRLFCFVKTDRWSAFDTKWQTFAPVVHPIPLPGQPGRKVDWGAMQPMAHMRQRGHLVLGPDAWSGVEDLSAAVRCARDAESLLLHVAVRDDTVLTQKDLSRPTMFFGDCIQLNLDCRPDAARGLPLFDRDVHLLFLVPGYPGPRVAEWSFGDSPERTVPPAGRWSGLAMESVRTDDGYQITLRIPLAALKPSSGEAPYSIGFDLVVDDTDTGRGRDSQMAWAGSALNHLDPSFYASLVLSPGEDAGNRPPGELVRVTLR